MPRNCYHKRQNGCRSIPETADLTDALFSLLRPSPKNAVPFCYWNLNYEWIVLFNFCTCPFYGKINTVLRLKTRSWRIEIQIITVNYNSNSLPSSRTWVPIIGLPFHFCRCLLHTYFKVKLLFKGDICGSKSSAPKTVFLKFCKETTMNIFLMY